MRPKEFENKMKEINKNCDTEDRHAEADSLMCETLVGLGFENGVGIFRDMNKWYS